MSNAKDPAERQRRNMPAVIPGSAAVGPPGPPSGLTPTAKRDWVALWKSPVAMLLDPVSDLPAVTRLFELRHLGARLTKQIAKAGVVDPALVSAQLRVAAEVRQLESALGMSPRSRLALGLALLAGRKAGTLDDAVEDADDDDT